MPSILKVPDFIGKAVVMTLVILFATVSVHRAFSQVRYDTLPNVPARYAQQLSVFKKEAVVTGKVLFLGSSVTENENWKRLLKDSTVVNRTIYGDNTFGVLQRLDEVIRYKPSRLFLQIGQNDLSRNVPTSLIIENIFMMVTRIRTASPKTHIYVQSLLPVNSSIKNFPMAYSKQTAIVEVNGQLKKYSDVLSYTYVDVHEQLLDKTSMLDTLFTVDGLKLSPAGYVLWIDFLRKNKFL